MKKISIKLPKLPKSRKIKEQEARSRITSDTVAEHRERILAGGRRFKYPLQYAKHKLVINAIIISVVALVILSFAGYWKLYKLQDTSSFFYRVTKVLPLPVANVDGQNVLYSDYLMKYRSSVHYLEQKEQVNLKSDDGKRQIEYIKQQSMDSSIADAYAQKIANELDIKVTEAEIDNFIKIQRQSSDGEISEQTYSAVILDYFGWNPEEYRRDTKKNIIRQKVSFAIDQTAKDSANEIQEFIKNDSGISFTDLSKKYNENENILYGSSGWVPKNNQDGGLSEAALNLKENEVSEIVQSTNGDGYYLVKLISISETQLKYEYIHISLSEFSKMLDVVVEDTSKTVLYIEI